MRSKMNERASRLDFQKAEMLENLNNVSANKSKAQVESDKQTLQEATYFSVGADLHNKRVKQNAIERNLKYGEHFAVVALTEALTACVESALLLDTEKYAEMNPEYKTQIKNTIRGFLEKAEINESINTSFASTIFPVIRDNTPSADLFLTEEDEDALVRSKIMDEKEISNALDAMKVDVRARVADIVTKDQEALVGEQDTIDNAAAKELTVAPVVPVENVPEVDATAPIADPDAVPMPEPAVEQTAPVAEEAKVTLNLVKKTHTPGILETLVSNEAMTMLDEGVEYNRDLAIANAIKYITILETLDASGIISIGQAGYNKILEASGVEHVAPKIEENRTPDVKANAVETEAPKNGSRVADILKKSMFDGNMGADPYASFDAKRIKEDIAKSSMFDGSLKCDCCKKSEAKYKNDKGEVMTESQVRAYIEKQGYDLDFVDFDFMCESWNFKRI